MLKIGLAAYTGEISQIRPNAGGMNQLGPGRIIHHSRDALLVIRHHSAFASLANTGSIRSVTEKTVMTNNLAIHSRSGELSRLGLAARLYGYRNQRIRVLVNRSRSAQVRSL